MAELIKVGELCDISSSKRIFAKEYQKSGIPFFRGKEVTEKYNGKLDVTTELFISEEKYSELESKFGVPNKGDMLLTSVGTLGSTYIVKESDKFYFKDGNLTWFKNFRNLNSHYLQYWLESPEGKAQLRKSEIGSSQSAYTIANLKEMQISLPLIDEQLSVVRYIKRYDNLIANNNRRIAILEDMAQSLYREWFVSFRYPNYQDNLDADGKPKLIDSPLGQIPDGWEVKKIKDLGVVNTGKTPSKAKQEYYSSADVPFLKTPDMHGAIFSVDIGDYLSLEGANSQKNKFVPANSVCVSCIGARAGVVTITSEKLQTNQQINSVVLNDTKYREYFYLFAVSLHQKIHALGSSGATMTNVNKSKFEGIEVIVPPEEVIQGFSSKTAFSFDLILNLQKRNKNLKKQRDMLLPKLISGQIELKD